MRNRLQRPMMHENVPLLAVVMLFFIHLAGIFLFDIYNSWPSFDIVTHFIGGFAIGLLAIHVYDRIAAMHGVRKWAVWQELLFVISFVMMIAVFWEFHEYVLDYAVRTWHRFGVSQLSLLDTMGDLFMGLLGGLAAHVLRQPIAQLGHQLFKKK